MKNSVTNWDMLSDSLVKMKPDDLTNNMSNQVRIYILILIGGWSKIIYEGDRMKYFVQIACDSKID